MVFRDKRLIFSYKMKKARLRIARPLLIVPFKKSLFRFYEPFCCGFSSCAHLNNIGAYRQR